MIRNILSRRLCTAITGKIQKLVEESPVVLFMKGNPTSPQCGFSRVVVQILQIHGVEDYKHHDVLEDTDLREGIKKFSNWPTVPQLYINGEFVGGCDILLSLHKSGEIRQELAKVGIKSPVQYEDEK